MGSPPGLAIHRSQEDIFERIAALVHAANLDSLFARDDVKISGFDVVGNHQLDSPVGK
jgi:hypothetical protein